MTSKPVQEAIAEAKKLGDYYAVFINGGYQTMERGNSLEAVRKSALASEGSRNVTCVRKATHEDIENWYQMGGVLLHGPSDLI